MPAPEPAVVSEPSIRGAMSRSLLAAVDRLDARERAEIRARVDAAILERIEGTFVGAWVTMRDHMALSDAVRDVVGPARNVEVWQSTMTSVFELPLMQGFVRMTRSLFGLTPMGLLKQAERIYTHLVRSAGVLRFDEVGEDGRSATFTLRRWPSHRFRFICYVEGLTGSFLGGVSITGERGHADVLEVNDETGTARYRVRW
jgi:hypothetical protein